MLVVGLMSGTSLDGLDICAVEFENADSKYAFKFIAGETFTYSKEWENKLQFAHLLNGEHLFELHKAFGRFCAQKVNEFIEKYTLKPELIASHGHTIFHNPKANYTFQLACGVEIAANTGLKTIYDFRSEDLAKGGQGAPLVPIGDQLLFNEYDYCLNLGGIANISFKKGNERLAYDVCGCNLILNYLAQLLGFEFDKNGDLASNGQVNNSVLNELNSWIYLTKALPKSLDKKEVLDFYLPKLEMLKSHDALATMVAHIAKQLGTAFNNTGSVLCTGGGAFNTQLVKTIQENTSSKIVVPDKSVVAFKEAIVFGFLGYLKVLNKTNILKSVTGANSNSCAGQIA